MGDDDLPLVPPPIQYFAVSRAVSPHKSWQSFVFIQTNPQDNTNIRSTLATTPQKMGDLSSSLTFSMFI